MDSSPPYSLPLIQHSSPPECSSTTDIAARLSSRESQYRGRRGADCGGTEIRSSADLSSATVASERVSGLQ
jgi:hypothetical protein